MIEPSSIAGRKSEPSAPVEEDRRREEAEVTRGPRARLRDADAGDSRPSPGGRGVRGPACSAAVRKRAPAATASAETKNETAERDRHRQRERPEEGAGHAGQEARTGRKITIVESARADQRRQDRCETRAGRAVRALLACRCDALGNDDGVVGDEPDRRGDSAERHEVDRLSRRAEREQDDRDGHGHDGRRRRGSGARCGGRRAARGPRAPTPIRIASRTPRTECDTNPPGRRRSSIGRRAGEDPGAARRVARPRRRSRPCSPTADG